MLISKGRAHSFAFLFVMFAELCASATPRLTPVNAIKQLYDPTARRELISWQGSPLHNRYLIRILDAAQQEIFTKKTQRLELKISEKLFVEGEMYRITVQALATSNFRASTSKKKDFVFSTKVKTAEFFGNVKAINSSGRRGVYFLPKNYRLKTLPVMLLFHGSSIDGKRIASIFKELAQKNQFIIVAPDSSDPIGWSIETESQLPRTEDQQHISACLSELKALPHLSIDAEHFLVAGVSAGGAVAGFYGSNDPEFSQLADLHGGIDFPSLGSNKIPVWLSTGNVDPLRPPSDLKGYQSRLPQYGFTDVTYQEFDAAHDVRNNEKAALISWWLSR